MSRRTHGEPTPRRIVPLLTLLALAAIAGPLGAQSTTLTVPGSANPWLAGMPPGSTGGSGDVAPAQSPAQVTGIPIAGDAMFSFIVTGEVGYGVGGLAGPDGFSSTLFTHLGGAQNGIASLQAPANALLGVFLGPDLPTASPAPGGLAFATEESRGFATLLPELQQPFFIGDGLTPGGDRQLFVAPSGASRLFLGTMDAYGWYNNVGAFEVTVTLDGAPPPAVVPEPGAVLLVASGLAVLGGVGLRRRPR